MNLPPTNLPNGLDEQVPNDLNLNPLYDLLNPLHGNNFEGLEEEFNINCTYLTENAAISKLKSFKEQLIILLSINCQSIHAKYNEILSCIDNFRNKGIMPTMLACQELWEQILTFLM